MRSRSTHTKSRTGCLRCKQRRVKCDENRPCRDCHRRRERCSLVTDHEYVKTFEKIQVPSPATSNATTNANSPQQSWLSYFPRYDSTQPVVSRTSPDWAEDLLLMNHWTASTYRTLLYRDAALETLQTGMPEMAMSYPFAMHIILAMSALHLSRLHPEKAEKWIALSTKHQDYGLPQFQAVLPNVTKENCRAVFVASCMLSLISLSHFSQPTPASALEGLTQQLSIDDVVAYFMMTRGVRDILHPAWDWLAEDRLSVMFAGYFVPNAATYPLPEEIRRVFQTLGMDLLPKHTRKHDSSTEACRFALSELELIYRDVIFMPAQDASRYNEAYSKRTDLELGVLMKWTTAVSTTFVNLIRARNTAALVLLAHWMVLFKHMGDRWFLNGWTDNALQVVRDALNEEEHSWLAWPEEYLRTT